MGKRVLLADDSATIQKLVKMALAGTSYELHSAFDGREALKLVDVATPDIVLADAIMPDMDGYELCRAVKDDPRLVGVPVVLLIGRFQPFDEQRANEAGIDERMIKPFSADNLIALIEKLLADSAAQRVPLTEEAEPGDMDATVNMSAEELAAHTSHWQQDQTAMTEDIPKIEDIEFDEDVQFDDDSVTSDLGEADTMMLEDALDDSADLDGPMTMELSTEDLADIDEPVTSFDEITNSIDPEDRILADDDDLEELDESDLLDDSMADFDGDFTTSPEVNPVALEDQDTGPLDEIKQSLPSFVPEDEEANDTQPNAEVPTFAETNDDFLQADEVLAVDEVSAEPDFSGEVDFATNNAGFEEPAVAVDMPDFGDEATLQVEENNEADDTDKTVAVSADWLAANMAKASQTEDDSSETPLVSSSDEPPLEVDDELPLEESAIEQDTLLDDADYEPLSSAIEEPLDDALLVEEAPTVSVEVDDDVLDPNEAGEPLNEEVDAPVDSGEVQDETPEEAKLDVSAMALPAPGVKLGLTMSDNTQKDESRFEMPTQQVPPPDFDDDEDLLAADSPADEEISDPELVSFSDEAPVESPAVEEEVLAAEDVPAAEDDPTEADFSGLSENQLNKLADMVAERVMRKFERDTLREIAWEVIPELSEAMIKKRIFELEREADKG